MTDDTTAGMFGTGEAGDSAGGDSAGGSEGGGALGDVGAAAGKAIGDLLGGGSPTGVDDWVKAIDAAKASTPPEAGESARRVWDEQVPDGDSPVDLTDPNVESVLPRTLDPETAAQQNAEQAASRQQAIEEGLDPQTAQLVYPDIDPNDPYRIN
jgi:hypothetical protein